MKKPVWFMLFCLCIMMTAPLTTSASDLPRGVIYDVPDEILEKQFGRIPAFQLTPEDSLAISQYRYTGDTIKILVIMVQWYNRLGTYPKETFDSMFFSWNYFPGGSISEYFDEVSYKQVHVAGQIINWYDAGNYWLFNPYSGFPNILVALDPVIDYSQLDGNNDGNVDAICFLHSGNGQEDSGNENDIWSFAMSYSNGFGPFDGKYITQWCTSPETYPMRDSLYPPNFSGQDTLNRIRVFCHELTHNLGLPDMYDYDDKLLISSFYTPNDNNDHPVYDWCNMGYGGYGILSLKSKVPSHLIGWNKKTIGWIDPVIVPAGTHNQVVINNYETTKDSSLYLIPITPSEGEYFLLEYRNPGSTGMFDKFDSDFSCYFFPYLSFGGDPLDRGLLITHVHDSLGAPFWRINNGTPEHPHYTVAVEDAGYNPAKDYTYNPGGNVSDTAQWWYPYESRKGAAFSSDVPGQEFFGPATTPNSDSYFGPTGIEVRVDSMVGDKLYAYIYSPIPRFPLLSPSDSAFGPIIINFKWTDANPWEDLKFDLYVSTSSAFHPDSTSIHSNLLTPQYTDSLQMGKRYFWKVKTHNDSEEKWSEETWTLVTAMYGDVNADNDLSTSDVIYLINHLFKGGPPPVIYESGDCNCDGDLTISDVIYLINYLFKGGPDPGC
ncbi:MAG: dockerin type I domain-containing protein [candidate division Zixibacteria bacterium]|nr:dockerin type I domain-containing protein [candidate division Zixibacteria bacterium]